MPALHAQTMIAVAEVAIRFGSSVGWSSMMRSATQRRHGFDFVFGEGGLRHES